MRWKQAVILSLTTCLCWGMITTSAMAERRTARLGDIAEHPTRSAPATTASLNHSTLSAQIQANVAAINVGVSATVSAGDTLLQLDCTDYQLARQLAQAGITIAEARLSLANSQKKRANQLLQKDLASREDADTLQAEAIAREAELEQAKITLRQATINTERCTIKAPFAGIITARLASEGQLASIGTPLITMIDTKHLELSAQVKPEEVTQLQQAQSLTFTAGADYPVRLSRLGGSINSATRDQEIRLEFISQPPPPGTAGKLTWQDPRAFLPARYIVQRDQQLGVMINEQGTARFVVIPNAIPGRSAAVSLAADTPVITNQLGSLQNGDALQPKSP